MDYTAHGIFQPRILEWVAFPFSRRSSQPGILYQLSRKGSPYIEYKSALLIYADCLAPKSLHLESCSELLPPENEIG